MTMNPVEQKTNGAYAKEWWQGLPARRRKQWRVGLGVVVAVWLAGALYGPSAVAGLARVEGPFRPLMALGLGGFSFLWRILKAAGALQETSREPNVLWIPLALAMPAAVAGILTLLGQPPHPLFDLRKRLEQMARGQGLHLTEALRHYPGPALVIDPKSEQFERTAALRSQLGPVYRIPGHQVHLSAYYRHLRDRDEVNELHYHLLRPWPAASPFFWKRRCPCSWRWGCTARPYAAIRCGCCWTWPKATRRRRSQRCASCRRRGGTWISLPTAPCPRRTRKTGL